MPVEAQVLFYPPDPASLEFCSIGGNAATNAGGPRAFKYGVTRESVLGIEVALIGGEVLRCGRRMSKGVTGYDLVASFVGTEGTFGEIELVVKLLPNPPAIATVLGVFRDVPAAGAAGSALLRGGLRSRALYALRCGRRRSAEHEPRSRPPKYTVTSASARPLRTSSISSLSGRLGDLPPLFIAPTEGEAQGGRHGDSPVAYVHLRPQLEARPPDPVDTNVDLALCPGDDFIRSCSRRHGGTTV